MLEKSFLLGFAAVLVVGCAESGQHAAIARGPVGAMVERAADESEVPADLMIAIGLVEHGLRLPLLREVHADDAVPVAGVLELRHGRFDSLARGAALMGRDETELRADLALGTRAGARVLADLAAARGIDRKNLAAWSDVVEEMSGYLATRDRVDYRARVFAALRDGGSFARADGETITLAPHDDVPLALTIAPPPEHALGNPEYPGAIFFDTPQANKWTQGREAPISMIAVHDTEGDWDASVATLQNDPGKSVHYIIDADGSRVGQFVYEADTAWHVGNWYYNVRMVGIEHVGVASVDDYQTALYVKSADLVKNIASRNKLTISRDIMVGHQEVPDGNNIPEDSPPCSDSPENCIASPNYGGANNHRDPGVYWEWCQYMELLGSVCKCNDAHAIFNCVHDLSERVRCNSGKVEIEHCPAGCMVEPNGVDDVCNPEPPVTSSSGAGGAGGAGVGPSASSGMPATTSSGAATSGAGGAPPGDTSDGNAHGGCACETGAPRGEGLGGVLALIGLACAASRRKIRGARRCGTGAAS